MTSGDKLYLSKSYTAFVIIPITGNICVLNYFTAMLLIFIFWKSLWGIIENSL